jgi:hypothetical protein
MTDDYKKDLRRQNIQGKSFKKQIISEEQRFLSKSKSQLKKKREELREEELWDAWEEDNI